MKALSVESWRTAQTKLLGLHHSARQFSTVLLSFLKELFINLDRLGVHLATFSSYFFRYHSKGCFYIQTVKF